MAKKPIRHKTAAAVAPVPQDRDQVTAAIREIGELQRQIVRTSTEMNDELAAVKERYEAQAQPLQARIDALTQGLQIWAEANRDRITQHGKTKTVAFPSGELNWRTRPPSVRVTGAEAVLDILRRMGLGRFIRSKEEVNKEAILNEPKAVANVPGISIQQGEDFVVTPFEAELAEVPQ